jgi:galactokinase
VNQTVKLLVRAPGRVNLIGEHTDYNDGFVLPAAIGYYTNVDARPRDDRLVEIGSDAFEDRVTYDLDRLPEERANDWTDYARGILVELEREGIALRGAVLRVSATLPLGSGLSSSASFEIAIALAMLACADATLDRTALALLAQRSEHAHVGIRSGIMDQFVVLHAHAGHALLLDTRSLAYEHVPVPHGAALVIANTMVKHALAGSEYNARRTECEAGVAALQRRFPEVRALRDASLAMLQACRGELDPTIYRRCRHVIAENARVFQAAEALRAGDLPRAGQSMNESHESLVHDYEVSCSELNAMVSLAQAHGAYGARMTGGGFGGCTINLVPAERVRNFREALVKAYSEETGIVPQLYDGTPVAGAALAHA